MRVALPPASALVLKAVDPSRKVTLPVGVPGVTVAVKVTLWPNCTGFALDTKATAEVAVVAVVVCVAEAAR